MNRQKTQSETHVLPRKQIGLGRFLLLSYLAAPVLVLVYYSAPYTNVGLQVAVIVFCIFSVVVGLLGIVVSLLISVAVAAFSRESEERKRSFQKTVMKMLITFVAITIGPSFVVMMIILTVDLVLGI